eukprot:5970557-Pyramimonas_sp.AAC.1
MHIASGHPRRQAELDNALAVDMLPNGPPNIRVCPRGSFKSSSPPSPAYLLITRDITIGPVDYPIETSSMRSSPVQPPGGHLEEGREHA